MTKKYMSDIHLEDYTSKYDSRQSTADTMVYDSGRERISLNGEWHYAVDKGSYIFGGQDDKK